MAMRLTHDANTVENKQSLKDYLTNLAPDDTPVVTELKTSKAIATVHEFVRYERSRPTDNGATIEGATVTYGTPQAPVRSTNYVQTITETWEVSIEQQESSRVGGQDEFTFRKAEAMKLWKMRLERSVLFNTGAAGNATTARQLAGMFNGTGVVSNTATLGGTLTENTLNGYLQTIWQETNKSNDMFAVFSPSVKRSLTNTFLGSFVRNIGETSVSKLKNYVTFYESEFGVVELVAHKDLVSGNSADGRALMFSKSAYQIAYMSEPKSEDTTTGQQNAKTGKIVGMATLEFLFPKAAIKVYNISY